MQAVLARESHGAVHLVGDGGAGSGRLAGADLGRCDGEQRALIGDAVPDYRGYGGGRLTGQRRKALLDGLKARDGLPN